MEDFDELQGVNRDGVHDEEEEVLPDREPKGKKRKKDYRLMKVEQYVFDDITLKTLYKFAQRGILKALGGPVSAGKESIVFHAIGGEAALTHATHATHADEDTEIAIKMYKVSTSNFNAMLEYIIGDPRFENIKKDRRSVVFAWARKEYKNLKRAYNAGVSVPRPIAYDKNVLVMEFIGANGVAAPRLKDVPEDILVEEAENILNRIIDNVKLLYEKAKLVHADLSEFNILLKFGDFTGEKIKSEENVSKGGEKVNVYDVDEVDEEVDELSEDKDEEDEEYEEYLIDDEGSGVEGTGVVERDEGGEIEITEEMLRDAEPVLIDFGQATLLAHPRAMDFLQRDIKNIIAFFRKLGLDVSYEDAYERIVRNEAN